MRRPNITTQALPGYDYQVHLEDGPVSQETVQRFAEDGFEPVILGPAPGHQTQVIFRKPKSPFVAQAPVKKR